MKNRQMKFATETKLQDDPYQNLPIKMAVALLIGVFDPMLVEQKCVLEL